MSSWVLVPSLVALRGEFNALAPGRDKASDGSIGDTAHAADGTSDHLPDEDFRALRDHDADAKNEVHALDVDAGLRLAGWSMQRCVDIIVGRHRSGADSRLAYVIFNRKIYSASHGWTARDYTGSSPHTEHAHFSARYTNSAESGTQPYGLLAAAAPPRKVDHMQLTVSVPVLREGDEDATLPGYNVIYRIQRVVGATADGVWGPQTTACIAAWCNVPAASAKTLTEDIWRNLMGAARVG